MKAWAVKKGNKYYKESSFGNGDFTKDVNKARLFGTKARAKEFSYSEETVVEVNVQVSEVK